MPEPKELELKFSGWEKEAVKYGDLLQQSSIRLDEVQVAYQKAQKKDVLPAGMSPEELAKWEQKSILGRILHFPTPPIITVPQERIQLRAQLGTIATDILRYEFYSRLYSVIPAAVMGNEVSSIDEALNIVAPPFGMSEADLNSVREIVQDMLTIQDIDSEPATQPRLPELVKPTERRLAPTTIQKLTIDALVRYMTAPKVPASTLDDFEWNELLLKAHPEYADMTQVEIVEAEAKRIIAESKLANEQMAGFQSAIAEMPDYKLTDFLKEAIMQPGLALLEVAGIYFEKVSQPLAASFYKAHIQDIEDLYQKHRIAGDDNWTALQKSWEEWDAPGSGVPEFLLKYMLMETLADPLTWLAGFSIGTSIAAGISGASRFVRFAVILNKTNRVIFAPFEAPFTGIKYLVGKLPKTISQRAAIVEGMTGRVVKQWMEQAAGKGKLLNKGMTMKDWDTLARRSVRYTFNNPQSVDPIAEVGRVLLKHEPISRDDLIRYAKRLGLTLTEPDVTPGMLVGVNTIFEAMFQKYGARTGKLMTSKEAGKRFLGVLGLGGADDTTYKKAVSILEARAKNIVNEAYAFAEAASPGKALQHLMKRNFDYHIEIERAMEQFLVSKSSRFNQLYAGVEARFVAIWQKYVEDIMIRPLAQSYLTFAMYGPMNVVEDHWRSILGGVFPRRMDHNRMALLGKGTSLDPDLVNPSLAVSETIGRMARKGGDDQWNNWILQLGGIVPKDWVDKLYTGLVRLPGGFGMDIRRNFVGQKYLVLFKEMGGETLERLYRVETRVGLPKLADKKLVKALRTSIQDAITTLDPEAVRAVGRTFTRKAIQRNEVVGITKEHPDLPNTVRDIFVQAFDDNTLYAQGVRSISTTMKRANTQLMDDYLKGGGYVTKQFQELTNVLTQMEVRNPEEMAHLLYNLNIASDIYGKVPEEILAAATVASQGKNLAARREHFDQIFDDILEFRDKAGGNLEKLVEKLRVDLKAGRTFNPDYTNKSNRLLDLLIAKKTLSDQFRLEDMAWRHELFAGVEAKAMTDEWWQNTYRQMRQRIKQHKTEIVGIEGDIFSALKGVDMAAGIQPFFRQPIKVVDRVLAPQDIASLVGAQGDDLSRALLDNLTIVNDRDMFVEYIMRQLRPGDEGFTRESIGEVFDQIARQARLRPDAISWVTSKQMELEAIRGDLHQLYLSKLLPDDEVKEVARYTNEVADGVKDMLFTEVPGKGKRMVSVLKPEFTNLQTIRQTAMDDAHTWYYKEFTDYTNANAFDAIMKGIFPFWNYESQRWFWLPRSFIRHPGTFTALERWQDNTDYGYIPVAGTSIEYNPYRGTVYGPLTTRLTRRDYPEYYDAWESAEPITEYFDWLSRYGFYPGGHLSIPMSLFGGLEVQAGEALPPIWESPLMLAQIALPKSESVKVLTDHIFSDRFRTYMTIQEVIARGGDGVVISAKLQRNEPLTDEEQSLWDESRRSAGGYSLLFENTGIFRLRHPEKRAVYKAATKYIEEKYNYTEDRQKWLRMHGHRIWDQIGGMSLEDQRILEEMEYFRYTGTIDRLLPGRQQLVLDKLTLAWNDVEKFVDLTIERKTQLELEFLSGQRGPDDYQSQLKRLYSEQQDFIYNKMRDNLDEPLPDGLSPEDERAFTKEHSVMELEGRRRYYEKWGIPLPVLHPLKELLNLYYSIELKEIADPETGELIRDWDTFWTQRKAVEDAVPDMWQGEFKTYITKNETRMEAIRRQVYQTYFTKYWWIWDQVLKGYNDTERRLIKEYISLENRGMDLPRQAVIKSTISEKTGNMLISSFRSDVSEARRALRYANPTLDAWLFYWGRTGTFLTPQAEEIYKRISKETGRKVEG